MNVYFFCAQTISRHICGTMGKGKVCPPRAGHNWAGWHLLMGMMLCHASASSAHEPTDSTAQSSTFRARQLVLPTALIAAGSVGVANGWLCTVKRNVRHDMQHLRGSCFFHADDYLQYLPVAANIGLDWLGAAPTHSLRERTAATATAYAVMGIAVNVTKMAVREKRPDTGKRNSFPSGHTATAFMGAELVRQEYGNGFGAGAYAFATGIAFLRLYNNRHWLNDVVAGAGIGILSARMGYWLLPWERKVLRWDKPSASLSVVPSYQHQSHAVTLAITHQF